MALGVVQAVVAAGTTANLQTPLSSETVIPAEDLVLHVKNASGSAITVTMVDASKTPGGSSATNPTRSVPATTGDVYIYIPVVYVDPTTGLVTVTFSATTSVTAEWLRV